MFSWGKPGGNDYPASKRTNNNNNNTPSSALAGGGLFASHNNAAVARPIRGTVRPPVYSREQHLESYLGDDTLKRSTRRISTDDTTYDTVFQTTARDTLILRVHLPTSSQSNAMPGMTLAGIRARHPWLDARMRITGYAPVSTQENWRNKGMLLGTAIHEVVKHLQMNPPEVIEITDAGLKAIQAKKESKPPPPPPAFQSPNNNNHQQQQQQPQSEDAPPNYDAMLRNVPGIKLPTMPPMDDLFADDMSREDLEQLLNDQLEFLTFANNLPFVKEVLDIRCQLLDENNTNAEANLARKEGYQKLQEEVNHLKKQYASSLSKFKQLETEQNAYLTPPSMKMVLKELTKTKKASYQKSEQLAEEWLDNDDDSDDDGDGTDPDAFVARFVKERMIQHLSAAKIELLQNAPRCGTC